MRLRRLASGLLVLSGLLLPIATARPDDPAPPSTEELRARYRNRKNEEREFHEKQAAVEERNKAALAEQQVREVVMIRGGGDPARSVDIAIIGDGFAEADQAEWVKVAERMASNYDTAPFDTHAARTNIYRIDLVSEVSGTAIDDPKITPPLGGSSRKFPGGKLLICDVKKAAALVKAAVPEVDYLMVVLNTHGKFKASANSGAIVLLSTAGGHQRSIVVHEYGHNFAGLYDEYEDPKQSGTGAPPARIGRGFNVSLKDNVFLTKWHHFNIPEEVFRGEKRGKPFTPLDVVRCYEGGATFTDGVYRPEENCHMQRGRGKAFCRVCTEAIELAIYRYAPPIASVFPATEEVRAGTGEKLRFGVVPLDLGEHADEARTSWYLDGKPIKGADPLKTPPVGTHFLTACVDIDSPRVHMDRGWLSGSFTWTLEIVEAGEPLGAPERVIGDVGEEISFTAKAGEGWKLASGPTGAEFDSATGEFSWTPGEDDYGAWRIRLSREEGGPPDVEEVLLTVRSPNKKRNLTPKPLFTPPQTVKQGETLTFRLLAFDPDGDHLAWSAKGLPEGASFAPNSGLFTWSPGFAASGTHEVTFELTDGVRRDKSLVTIEVEQAALIRGIFRMDPAKVPPCDGPVDRYLLGLHHPVPKTRLENAKTLEAAPPQARLAESIRLCREIFPALSSVAFDHLRSIFTRAAAKGETDHLPMFTAEMPRRIWQFVDRQEDLGKIKGLCETALGTEGLARSYRKELQALLADIDAIETYNRERKEWEPRPAIRDKKFK